MLHDILSRHLGIPEHRVRVINKDVGGSFGLKIHTYPDEIATCALAVMLGRPVKFLADRIESFQTDIHSRDHRVTAEVAVKRDGTILAMRLDDLAPVGALLDVSALERGRVRPGPAHHARPLPPARLRGARPRGAPEQDADVAVPRRRPPGRRARHGGHGRSRRARAVARSRRRAAPEPPDRRHVSVHRAHRALLREALARGVARRGAGAVGLSRALRRARPAPRPRRPPRARPLRLHRPDGAGRRRRTAPAGRASRRRTARRSASSRAAS